MGGSPPFPKTKNIMQKNTFTKQFKTSNTKPEFINILMDEDLEAFICPFLIENNKKEKIVLNINNQIHNFLTKLNKSYIKPNDKNNGLDFLSHLHEPNEYHLGYSSTNKGKAVSNPRAELIYDALRNNRFSKGGSSITNEAHFVLLLVKGIGQDIISDIISNVCRNIFADFTLNICRKYKIKTEKFNIEFYNSSKEIWEKKDVQLPSYKGKKIILIPRFIISGGRDYVNRYNWFISKNYIAHDILNGKLQLPNESQMVKKLKDGTKKAIIKRIYMQFRKPKKELIDFVIDYSGSLDEFVRYAKYNYPELDINSII